MYKYKACVYINSLVLHILGEKSEGVLRKLQSIEETMKTMTKMMDDMSTEMQLLKNQATLMPEGTGNLCIHFIIHHNYSFGIQ